MTAVIDEAPASENHINSGLILRDEPTLYLEDVLNTWNRVRSTWGGGIHQVSTRLEEDQPLLVFGEHEIKATDLGIEALARFLGMPVRYLLAIPRDEQQWMFERRIERSGDTNLYIAFTSDGLEEVVEGGKVRIEPHQIADTAAEVMPLESPVRDAWVNPSDLRLDLFMPLGFDSHWGGDREVGDLTGGGLRFFQNRKQNLAPGVQPFAYRLACTNGMELPDLGIRVDARGKDADEILMNLSSEAGRALDRVDADIRSFYDMRSQKVGADRTGALRRIALEAGLSERVVGSLENALPSRLNEDEEATMFDFVNLMTNWANMSPTSTHARRLQTAGGSLVNDHTARCSACHHRL